ncbi:MAG: peptidoglycan bridge formation glycyltransferase FemA/FemB family protein [Deltaproteobacteria bacterium]|nr:peptidoglycan bridge formation glycyltransferase FemA/FemB family protein [Deltaproteobacteria bacterium]
MKPIDDIHKEIKSSTRRNIKKAEKAGVKIKTGICKKDYIAFYELMTETRKRQGSPPYSKAFFTHLFSNLDSSQIQLFMAFKNDQPIAGIIMFYHGATALYAYGASVSDTKLLQMRPNDLLFWTVIKDANQKGFKDFDFGITHLSNQGLLRFKSQWGTINEEFKYTYYLNNINRTPSIDRSGKIAKLISRIFRVAPPPLLKITGPIALKLLG